MLILGMFIPKRFPLGPIEALLKVEHKGIISKEVVALEITNSMVLSLITKHPHRIVKGAFATPQEEIMMGLELDMVPPVVMDPIIALLMVYIMTLLAPQVVMCGGSPDDPYEVGSESSLSSKP